MKLRLNVCLTQDEVEILNELAKVNSLSKSAMLGKLLTQGGHITQPVQIQNEYTPMPHLDGLEQSLNEIKKLLTSIHTLQDNYQEAVVNFKNEVRQGTIPNSNMDDEVTKDLYEKIEDITEALGDKCDLNHSHD